MTGALGLDRFPGPPGLWKQLQLPLCLRRPRHHRKKSIHPGRLFPEAQLWGLDLSPDMLVRARQKLRRMDHQLTLLQASYDRPVAQGQFDLVVFSYALSMFNPGWDLALETAIRDLSTTGMMAVVDFHDSPSANFKHWMGLHHVCLNSHVLPRLRNSFNSGEWAVREAYGGLWSYFFFLGRDPDGLKSP